MDVSAHRDGALDPRDVLFFGQDLARRVAHLLDLRLRQELALGQLRHPLLLRRHIQIQLTVARHRAARGERRESERGERRRGSCRTMNARRHSQQPPLESALPTYRSCHPLLSSFALASARLCSCECCGCSAARLLQCGSRGGSDLERSGAGGSSRGALDSQQLAQGTRQHHTHECKQQQTAKI